MTVFDIALGVFFGQLLFLLCMLGYNAGKYLGEVYLLGRSIKKALKEKPVEPVTLVNEPTKH